MAWLEQAQSKNHDSIIVELTDQSIEKATNGVAVKQRVQQSTQDSVVAKELLTTSEMAFLLGVSKRSFQRLLSVTAIPRIYIGRRILFSKDNVLDFLHQNRIK